MERIIYYTISILLASAITVGAQDTTCMFLPYVSFDSYTEKQELTKECRSGNGDMLKLYLASCNKSDTSNIRKYIDRFETYYKTLKESVKPSWKEEKTIKKVFSDVHETFLKKYRLKSDFHEIFETGTYNCVTASALYALLFEQLQIPYEVKETPEHVFLLAYPETKSIKVETVDPVAGYYAPDETFKKIYIRYLNTQKIISDGEINSETTDQLFDEYYYGKESINLTELLALHYYNDAIILYNNEDYREALNQIEKSMMIYSNEPIRYIGFSCLVKVIDGLTYDSIDDAKYFSMMEEYLDNGIQRENIIYEFNKITSKHLINEGNEDLYKEFYQNILSSIKDSLLTEEISLIYNYELGRHLFNRGQRESAMNYFKRALDIRPNNSDIQMAFVQSLLRNVQNMEREKAVDFIEGIYSQYEDLDNNTLFINVLLTSYLMAAQHKLTVGKSVDGLNYISKFEKLYSSNSDLELDTSLIGDVYSSAAVYYYKRGMKLKAQMVIEKGLEFAPNNFQLQYCLTSF